MALTALCRNIEARQRLARAGNAGDEADRLARIGLGVFDDGGDGVLCAAEIDGAGVRT